MSVPSTTIKSLETDTGGTVTQWIPIPTAYPIQGGCSKALMSAQSGNLTGGDPGYSATVDASITCWPAEATAWWDQSDRRTTTSLGPALCPQAYYTVTTSEKNKASTLVACCPLDYVFQQNAPIAIVGPNSQCISTITEGQLFEFASDFGGDVGWQKTSTIAAEETSVIGVPFNIWQFDVASDTRALSTFMPASTTLTASTIATFQPMFTVPPPPTQNADVASVIPDDELSTKAKVGIGVGVGIGVLLATGLLIWIFVDPLARIRHRRNADRVEAASRAQGRGRSPSPSALQSPTPPSLREIVLDNPTPTSLMSPRWVNRPQETSPIPPSEVMSLSSGGASGRSPAQPQDMTKLQYHDDAAPAPVIGGIGISRSGSAPSKHGASSSFSNRSVRRNNYSAQEWVGTSGQTSHTRSGSVQSLYAIGSQRRPSTAKSGGSTARTGKSIPAVGLWGIDPEGKGRTGSFDRARRGDWSSGPPGNPIEHVSGSGKGKAPAFVPTGSQGTAGASGPVSTQETIARSASQRSARIITSPIEMAGQRYDMALEIQGR